MTALRTQLEDGVVKDLETNLGAEAEGGYLQLVRAYAGDIGPTRTDDDFLRMTQGKAPAVLVQTGDGAYSDHTIGRIATLDIVLNLLIVSRNLRSQEDRVRSEEDAHPGIYEMIEDIRERLWRRELDVAGVGFLLPREESSILRTPDMSIWLLTYSVDTDAKLASIEDEAGDLLGIDNKHNFPAAEDGAPLNPVIQSEVELT